MEGPRAHLASPERTKGAFVGTHEDYIVGGGRASPGRTQVAWCDAMEDQGRVGRHPEGLRARWVAPRRRIPAVR